MSDWKPIETAPKTQNEILSFGSAGFRIVTWNDDAYAKKPKPYWTWYDFSKTRMRNNQPTHWVPLPVPPTNES